MNQPGAVQSRSSSPQVLDYLLLVLIIGVGAFLRFHMLGVRSLWPPECFSFLVARRATLSVTVLSWSLLFPLVTITAVSFAKPVLYPRYLLMCLPAAVLLAGQGLSLIAQLLPRGRVVLSAALVIMIAVEFLGAHRFDAELPFSGNDWRSVSHYILQHQEPGDAVIFYTFGGNWTWEYYVGREREAGYRATPPPTLFPLAFDRASIANRTAPFRRVWLVLQQDIPTPQSDANDALLVSSLGEHFLQADKQEFPGQTMVPGLDPSIHLSLYIANPVRTSP